MFEEPKYIQNSFNIIFPRVATIRRKANDFEDMLKGKYSPPQIIPFPDEIDPEVPRIIFGSTHGYSQIIISQTNLILSINYSEDWQNEIFKGRDYLLERLPLLFKLINILEGTKPNFCGFITKVQLIAKKN